MMGHLSNFQRHGILDPERSRERQNAEDPPPQGYVSGLETGEHPLYIKSLPNHTESFQVLCRRAWEAHSLLGGRSLFLIKPR